MYYRDETTGNYLPINIKALDSMPIGSIIQFAGSDIPTGWLVCNGDAVEITDYPDLYDVIGTTYGGGNTNFRLPDLRGRVPVGLDPTDQLETFDTLGNSGGERTHTLTISEMPSHTHRVPYIDSISPQGGGSDPSYGLVKSSWQQDSGSKGGDEPHNNLQPYLVVNFIIKATNTTPTMASVVNQTNSSTEDSYSCNYANEHYGGVVLYENATGTSGNITLSDDISNYRYIEITWGVNGETQITRDVRKYEAFDGMYINYLRTYITNALYLYATMGTISGTTLTITKYSRGQYNNQSYDGNFNSIYKIVGYK